VTFREMCRCVREDWIAHERDWSRPGFRALAVHRFGNWRVGLEPRILRAPFSIVYRHLYRFVRNRYGIELPYSTRVGRRVIIEHQSCIVIHGASVIGDECVIRQGVTIGNRDWATRFQAPHLEERVNVGAGAKLLGPIRIGAGASIGANAVVLEDVPAGATAVGVPARVLPGEPKSDPKTMPRGRA
jgi:serine O-acetyltransferase